MLMNNNEYLDLVQMVKQEIGQAQYKATLSVNKELIMLYHDIGRIINEHKSWGNKFIENLAADIIGVSEYKVTSDLPEDLSKQLPSIEDIHKHIEMNKTENPNMKEWG